MALDKFSESGMFWAEILLLNLRFFCIIIARYTPQLTSIVIMYMSTTTTMQMINFSFGSAIIVTFGQPVNWERNIIIKLSIFKYVYTYLKSFLNIMKNTWLLFYLLDQMIWPFKKFIDMWEKALV